MTLLITLSILVLFLYKKNNTIYNKDGSISTLVKNSDGSTKYVITPLPNPVKYYEDLYVKIYESIKGINFGNPELIAIIKTLNKAELHYVAKHYTSPTKVNFEKAISQEYSKAKMLLFPKNKADYEYLVLRFKESSLKLG